MLKKKESVDKIMFKSILTILNDCKKSNEYLQNTEDFELNLSVSDEYLMLLNNSHCFIEKKYYSLLIKKLKLQQDSKFKNSLSALVERIKESLEFYVRNNFLKIDFIKPFYVKDDSVPMENILNSTSIQTYCINSKKFEKKYFIYINDTFDNISIKTILKKNKQIFIVFIDIEKIEKINFFLFYEILKTRNYFIHVFVFSKLNSNESNLLLFNTKINEYLKHFLLNEKFEFELLLFHNIINFEIFSTLYNFNFEKDFISYEINNEFKICEINVNFHNCKFMLNNFINSTLFENKYSNFNESFSNENLDSFNNLKNILLLSDNNSELNNEKTCDINDLKDLNEFKDFSNNFGSNLNNNSYVNYNSENIAMKNEYKKIKHYVKSYVSKHNLKDLKITHFIEIKMKKNISFNQDFEINFKENSKIDLFYCVNSKFTSYLNNFLQFFINEKLDPYISTIGIILNYKSFVIKFIEKLKSNFENKSVEFMRLYIDYKINYNFDKSYENGFRELTIENSNSSISQYISYNKQNTELFKEVKNEFAEILTKSNYPLKIELKLFPSLKVNDEFVIYNENMKIIETNIKFTKSNRANSLVLAIIIKLKKAFLLNDEFFKFLQLINSNKIIIITLGNKILHNLLINNYKTFQEFPTNIEILNIDPEKNYKHLIYSIYNLKNTSINLNSNCDKNNCNTFAFFVVKNNKIIAKSQKLLDTSVIYNFKQGESDNNNTLIKSDSQTHNTSESIDTFASTFKQINSSMKSLKQMIDSEVLFVSKVKYDINLKINLRFNSDFTQSLPLISKPILNFKIHEYDLEIINTILNETINLNLDKKNYILNLTTKLKNLDMSSNDERLIFRNTKGLRKGYVSGSLFGIKRYENEKQCCEQCMLY